MARKIAYAAKRAVFSRKAPTHPVNPIRNVMAPFKQRIKIQCLQTTNDLIHFMHISILKNKTIFIFTCPYKDKCRIQGDVGKQGQIVKSIFFCPCPDTNGQNT